MSKLTATDTTASIAVDGCVLSQPTDQVHEQLEKHHKKQDTASWCQAESEAPVSSLVLFSVERKSLNMDMNRSRVFLVTITINWVIVIRSEFFSCSRLPSLSKTSATSVLLNVTGISSLSLTTSSSLFSLRTQSWKQDSLCTGTAVLSALTKCRPWTAKSIGCVTPRAVSWSTHSSTDRSS